ncbi:MAG: c-type cytochrome [Thiovulaceae bacterium]|nr:c-type cytochrome [Sulfurimonadaceae bacterium]
MTTLKNIIVGILTIAVIALMAMTYMRGGAYQGGEHARVIKDMGSMGMEQTVAAVIPAEKDDRAKEQEELTSLRDKVGNVGAFNVSQEYKRKCASCHGVNGMGKQNGKKLMGPKLFGQSADQLYTKLADFKAGRIGNTIMKGLLTHLNDKDLRTFSDEIGAFPERAEALEK